MGLTAGPIGALSVAVFADGRWGQGWNNISKVGDAALVDSAQISLGVSGIFVTRDIAQLKAQIIGLAVLGLWGLLWGAAFGLFVRIISPQEPKEQDNSIIKDEPDTRPVLLDMETDMTHKYAPDATEQVVSDESPDDVSEASQDNDLAAKGDTAADVIKHEA
jgi:hypothetical protein